MMQAPKVFSVLLLLATAAHGQVRLPSLGLPGLAPPNLPQTVDQTEAGIRKRSSEARRLAARELLRANRGVLEPDPQGDPIVRGEILALTEAGDAAERIESHGFVIERRQAIAGSDRGLAVIKVPADLATSRALRELRAEDPDGVYDFNHIYSSGGLRADGPATGAAPRESANRPPRPRIRVGLLDTGIDSTHPVFDDSRVHRWGCGGAKVPSAHGTAVASLLLAHASGELYAADVYCGAPTGGAVDGIVAALAWMEQEHVAVVNVSLVGPRNLLLERSVSALIDAGHVIVAAVGNDGPAAPPLYPAAYAHVVGVTAVDAQRRVLIEAERGPQVMFAAPGADLEAANLDHGYAVVRGTSFAAPTVAALLAVPLPSPDKEAAAAAVAALATQAIDLGPPGKDLTYGFGLVGANAP
jgi:hypothetical protein